MTESPERGLPQSIALPQPGGALVLARDPGPEVDIALDDHSVSRKPHARIRRELGGAVFIDDLSGGRTTVKGRTADAAVLDDGEWLRIGELPFERVGDALELRLEQDGLRVRARGLRVDVAAPRGIKRLLDRVDLDIAANEFVGIIGPSGAGKSTLLRVLANEQPLSAGFLAFEDHRGALPTDALAESLGFVPQADALPENLSVERGLAYSAELRLGAVDRASRRRAVDAALRALNIRALATRKVDDSLSGGQRKRVNIAHEILGLPRLLCLDEPTAGLDPALERGLMEAFRDRARQGCTVLCTTHILGSLGLFDRVIVLAEGGRLAYSGPPDGLLAAFEIEDIGELYPKLSGAAALAFAPSGGGEPERAPSSLRRPPPPASWLRQAGVVFRRASRATAFDPVTAATTLALPLIVGLGIRLALPDLVDRDSALFFGVVAALWFGLQGSSLALIRERALFLREHRTGLRVSPYLLGKFAERALCGLVQVLVLSATFYLAFDGDAALGLPSGLLPSLLSSTGPPGLDLYALAVLWAAYAVGSSLGFLLSSHLESERQASLIVPMVLIPMLLFSAKGMATSDTLRWLAESPPQLPREWVAAFNPARHAYELVYFELRKQAAPGLREAAFEYGFLAALPLLFLVLAALRLLRRGRRGVVILGELPLDELDRADIDEEQRARALLAARVFVGRGRCPRCGWRAELEDGCPRCAISPLSPKAGEHLRAAEGARELARGAWYLARGFWAMARRPRLRRWSAVPLLLNIALIVGAYFLARELADFLADAPSRLGGWSGPFWGRARFAVAALAKLAADLSLVFVPAATALLFSLVGRPLFMPLMELVAEKTVDDVIGDPPEEGFRLGAFVRNAVRGLIDALLVTVLQMVLLVALLPLAYLPLIGPPLWFLLPPSIGAGIDFMDLNLVVRQYGFYEKLRLLWRRKGRILGFGLAFFGALQIPWVNLILGMALLPAASVGGALLYLELDER